MTSTGLIFWESSKHRKLASIRHFHDSCCGIPRSWSASLRLHRGSKWQKLARIKFDYVISRIFTNRFQQIWIISVCILKTCQTVERISMTSLFHKFFLLNFWRVFVIWNLWVPRHRRCPHHHLVKTESLFPIWNYLLTFPTVPPTVASDTMPFSMNKLEYMFNTFPLYYTVLDMKLKVTSQHILYFQAQTKYKLH